MNRFSRLKSHTDIYGLSIVEGAKNDLEQEYCNLHEGYHFVICEWFLYNLGIKSKRERER
jgi:hypothetical protein